VRFTRRSLLSGVGAGTATLLGRPLLRQSLADGAGPRRLLVLYMPNCNIREQWLPSGGRQVGNGTGDATQFTLGTSSAALEPVRSQLTLVTGLDLKNIGGDPHGSGIIRMMTGGTIRAGEKARDPGDGTLGTGNLPLLPSIDQILVDRSPVLKGPPFYSLQLAGDTRADDGRTDVHLRVMSYDLKTTPMPPDTAPSATLARVFGNLAPATSGPDGSAAVARALKEDRSVLDFVQRDLGRLQARLPALERAKLDSHLDALREYERSLVAGSASAGPVTVPTSLDPVTPNKSADHPKIVSEFFGLTKLAFQLDLTRVVTFMFGSGNSQVSFADIAGTGKGLHPVAHDYKAGPLGQATSWYCATVAKFIQDLAATKDLDGSSILDNTVVVMFSETAQYHEFTNVPFALFGGSKLGLTGGRCLQYTGRTPADAWAAIAGAFGVPMASFGDAAYSKGPLPELFA
jgi:hypothetical protein